MQQTTGNAAVAPLIAARNLEARPALARATTTKTDTPGAGDWRDTLGSGFDTVVTALTGRIEASVGRDGEKRAADVVMVRGLCVGGFFVVPCSGVPWPPPDGRRSSARSRPRPFARSAQLEVAADQRSFVAPNAVSIAEAHFTTGHWMQAIDADGQPVGFVLTFDDPSEGYFLWRFTIADGHQRRGISRHAMQQVLEHWRELGVTAARTSVVPSNTGATRLSESARLAAHRRGGPRENS